MRRPMSSFVIALVGWSLAGTALGAPCAGFTDVEDTNPFCVNVTWMRNRAITLGCSATLYCPNDFVTRLQMAAFMYRLGVQNAFLHLGSRFGEPAVLGTTDGQPMEIIASGERVMRYEPDLLSPNLIGGSPLNLAGPGTHGATIGGGGAPPGSEMLLNNEAPNFVYDVYGTVGGGLNNIAGSNDPDTYSAPVATVAGGMLNRASAQGASVGGGLANQASGDYGTVGGGQSNTASALASAVGGGSGNAASGDYSMAAGGRSNIAAGSYSFAAGRNANAGSSGCFVWSDSSHATDETQCGVANAFVARAKGGFYLITGGSFGSYSGAFLAPGATAWTTFSDRDGKENFGAVDARAVLEQVVALPIRTWNWKAQDASIRHIGPMAQDFHAAFGLGETPLGISTVDADGIALAAIQGLNAKLDAKEAEIAALRREVDELRASVRALLQSR